MVVSSGVLANGGEVVVPIIDSSESGHGPEDIRTSARTTGLGRGSTVLIVDGRGAPTGYRWSAGPSSTPHLTKVALAHLE